MTDKAPVVDERLKLYTQLYPNYQNLTQLISTNF